MAGAPPVYAVVHYVMKFRRRQIVEHLSEYALVILRDLYWI